MKTVIRIANLRAAMLVLALILIGSASAAPGLYHQPARDGHGLSISQPTEAGHSVIWYLYREDGTATFLIADPCESFPCVSALYEPTANFMGGGLDLGEPVGDIEIGQYNGVTLPVRFDLREWRPEECFGISPGGVLFRQCGGRIDFTRLAD